jgi:hypothetical protein
MHSKAVKFKAQVLVNAGYNGYRSHPPTPSTPGYPTYSGYSPQISLPPNTPSPSNGCRLVLEQERGAKSSLEIVAIRLKHEWKSVQVLLFLRPSL